MDNRFEKCCFDYDVIRSTTQCDWLNFEEKLNPAFTAYYHKNNNEFCYCLNCEQLGQCWRCIVEDNALLCPTNCEKCTVCKETCHIFTELQDSWFFYPNTKVQTISKSKSYQPVKWRIFTAANKKGFRIQIAKSVPHIGLVVDDGRTCWSTICCFFGS